MTKEPLIYGFTEAQWKAIYQFCDRTPVGEYWFDNIGQWIQRFTNNYKMTQEELDKKCDEVWAVVLPSEETMKETKIKQSNQLLCSNCKSEDFKIYFNLINNITLICNECKEKRIIKVIRNEE